MPPSAELKQIRKDIADLAADLKELERELKETDKDQEERLIMVKGYFDAVVLTIGDADSVKEMKRNASRGGLAYMIVWGALSALGIALAATVVTWVVSGGLSKKADSAPPRMNPAMIGPPSPK